MTRRMVGGGLIESAGMVTLSLVHEASGLQLRRLEMVTSVTMFRRLQMVTRMVGMVASMTMRMVELRGAQRGGGVGGREEAAVAELTLVGGADVEWSHHQGLLGVGESFCIGQL